MFEKATRKKVRFESTRGILSVEDLWDIPLEELDKIAVKLSEEVNKDSASFISVSKTNPTDKLKFDIAKYIIEVRLSEKQEKVEALEKKQKRDKILEIIERKEDESLQNKDVSELKKMLDEI